MARKTLFVPKSLKRGGGGKHAILATFIVIMAAWPAKMKDKKKSFVTPEGGKIPPHYHWGVIRDCVSRMGVKVGEIIVNFHAFCTAALFGKGRKGDTVAVRVTIEQKVEDQQIFHPMVEAIRDYLGVGKHADLAGDPAVLNFGLRCMRAILIRWPEMVNEDGILLQEVFGDYINPRFRSEKDDFIPNENWLRLQEDEEYLLSFLELLEGCTFEAPFNPVSFSGVTKEELAEAARKGELYELKIQADQREFARLQAEAVFSVRQEKHFGLHFYDSGKYADEEGYTLRPDYCRDRFTGWRVACNPHPVLIAAVPLPEKQLNGLRRLLKVEASAPASDAADADPAQAQA
ncbi:MAG TPA: hypothetical protein PL066_02300 [bacterium]|nr:hypothetical protein [bacterium]